MLTSPFGPKPTEEDFLGYQPAPGAVVVGYGRNRVAYRHGDWVIKIPLNDYGYSDNGWEARTSRKHGGRPDLDGVCYARCRLLANGWLVMRWAEPLALAECPSWADWVDCRQVGRTSSGQIVAYDYGLH